MAWKELKGNLIVDTDRFIPKTMGVAWKHKPGWKHPINKGTKQLIKRKHRLWARYMETKDPEVEKNTS